jgi:hypothetical protein
LIEPLKNADPASLSPQGRLLHDRVMHDMDDAGAPFRAIECVRTAERQGWLYAQGRTIPGPHAGKSGFPSLGLVVTQKDGGPGLWPPDHRPASEAGKPRRSNHQERTPGAGGDAFDAWPVGSDGRVYCPRTIDPIWTTYARAIVSHGGRTGLSWGDAPHAEVKSV